MLTNKKQEIMQGFKYARVAVNMLKEFRDGKETSRKNLYPVVTTY